MSLFASAFRIEQESFGNASDAVFSLPVLAHASESKAWVVSVNADGYPH